MVRLGTSSIAFGGLPARLCLGKTRSAASADYGTVLGTYIATVNGAPGSYLPSINHYIMCSTGHFNLTAKYADPVTQRRLAWYELYFQVRKPCHRAQPDGRHVPLLRAAVHAAQAAGIAEAGIADQVTARMIQLNAV